MRLPAFLALLITASVLPLSSIACSDESTTPATGDIPAAISDVRFDLAHEGLEEMLEVSAKTGKSVKILSPLAGTPFDVATKVSVSLESGTIGLNGTVPPSTRPKVFVSPKVDRSLLSVKSAWAHGPAFSGEAYFVAFTSGGAPLVRVFTGKRELELLAAEQDKLKNATGPIELRVTAAIFDDGRVVEGTFSSGNAVAVTIKN